jgi:subtilisin family serine protease
MTVVGHLPPYRVEAVAQSLPPGGVDWSLHAYSIPSLWSRQQGEGVRVAVLDTGVQPDHPALQGAVKEHRNFTTDESPFDTNGHGTHVAGVIAARGPMTGIAPKAEVVSCKVLGNSGSGNMDSVARAVLFAIEQRCSIICMSLGAPVASERLREACYKAWQEGVAVVCAAGNDGGPVCYPAAFPETVAVGAVDRTGALCEFSCRGTEVDVVAPGEDIASCWINSGYATLSGTSMATPFVVGVFALAGAKCQHGRIGQQKHAILQATCTDVGQPGKDVDYGWGLINPHAVLDLPCKVLV